VARLTDSHGVQTGRGCAMLARERSVTQFTPSPVPVPGGPVTRPPADAVAPSHDGGHQTIDRDMVRVRNHAAKRKKAAGCPEKAMTDRFGVSFG